MRSFYVSVKDFIYETVPSNDQMLIYNSMMRNHGEVLFEGTPDDLFDNNKPLAQDFGSWYVAVVAANNNVLEIGCFKR